ncbi:MAG: bifunctional glutamine synthetase adenylyltransferase/deadenyltransferase, partial [Paraburkholderia sp.]|nr:bifunctional glutamine synthetase adenylyltransferase/deadenyltransferase [Paraburkholderia sp.]
MNDLPLLSSRYSRYAARAYAARPELAAQVEALAAAPLTRERIVARFDTLSRQLVGAAGSQAGAGASPAPAAPLTDEQLKKILRQLRAEVICAVMERDLGGVADVAEVTGSMTDLAEVAIQRALACVSADLEAL